MTTGKPHGLTKEITEQEAKAYEEAFLEDIDEEEIKGAMLPDGAANGEGECRRGLSYVFCQGKWHRLVNDRGHHYFCHYGNGKFIRCRSTLYVATV